MKQDESDRYQIAKPFFFHGTYKENDCSQKMKKKNPNKMLNQLQMVAQGAKTSTSQDTEQRLCL